MQLLRLRVGFRRLWASQLVSLMGDWLGFVAISLLALDHGDGAVALALVLVAHSLPHAVMAPVAGALVDRFDRVRLIIGSNLAQAALTGGMVVAAASGQLVWVQLLLILRTAIAAVVVPAQRAVLPHLVESDELLRANAITSATWSVAFALGMALGGVLALLGPALALTLDALTFVIAAGIVRRLPRIAANRRERATISVALSATRRDMAEAARHILGDRPLLVAVMAKFPLAVAGGAAWVLLNLVAADPAFIGAGGLALGLLHAIRGIGTGVGPLWTMARLERGFDERAARTEAYAIFFAAVAVFTVLSGWWPLALCAVFFWGWGTGTNWVIATTSLQRHAPDRVIGRVSAIESLLTTAAMAAGALAGAVAVDVSGEPELAGAVGLALGIAGWMVVMLVEQSPRRSPTARELVHLVEDPHE